MAAAFFSLFHVSTSQLSTACLFLFAVVEVEGAFALSGESPSSISKSPPSFTFAFILLVAVLEDEAVALDPVPPTDIEQAALVETIFFTFSSFLRTKEAIFVFAFDFCPPPTAAAGIRDAALLRRKELEDTAEHVVGASGCLS